MVRTCPGELNLFARHGYLSQVTRMADALKAAILTVET